MTSGWISEFFNSIAPKRAFGVAGSNGVTGALSPSTAAAVPFAGVGVHDVGDELAFGATQDAKNIVLSAGQIGGFEHLFCFLTKDISRLK